MNLSCTRHFTIYEDVCHFSRCAVNKDIIFSISTAAVRGDKDDMARALQPTALRDRSGGTLSANIIAYIRERLFAGHIKPGERLGGEASLAETFGVSRMAMRDAIRTLAAMGVIEVRRGAGGGVKVASADVGRFADALAIQLTLLGVSRVDLIEAQIATEAMITRLAAERAGAVDIAELSKLLADAGTYAADSVLFAQAIGAFHGALARIAGNPALAVMLGGILQLLEAEYIGDTTPARAAGVLRRYEGVVAAIRQSDGDGAAALMRDHLANVLAFKPVKDACTITGARTNNASAGMAAWQRMSAL